MPKQQDDNNTAPAAAAAADDDRNNDAVAAKKQQLIQDYLDYYNNDVTATSPPAVYKRTNATTTRSLTHPVVDDYAADDTSTEDMLVASEAGSTASSLASRRRKARDYQRAKQQLTELEVYNKNALAPTLGISSWSPRFVNNSNKRFELQKQLKWLGLLLLVCLLQTYTNWVSHPELLLGIVGLGEAPEAGGRSLSANNNKYPDVPYDDFAAKYEPSEDQFMRDYNDDDNIPLDDDEEKIVDQEPGFAGDEDKEDQEGADAAEKIVDYEPGFADEAMFDGFTTDDLSEPVGEDEAAAGALSATPVKSSGPVAWCVLDANDEQGLPAQEAAKRLLFPCWSWFESVREEQRAASEATLHAEVTCGFWLKGLEDGGVDSALLSWTRTLATAMDCQVTLDEPNDAKSETIMYHRQAAQVNEDGELMWFEHPRDALSLRDQLLQATAAAPPPKLRGAEAVVLPSVSRPMVSIGMVVLREGPNNADSNGSSTGEESSVYSQIWQQVTDAILSQTNIDLERDDDDLFQRREAANDENRRTTEDEAEDKALDATAKSVLTAVRKGIEQQSGASVVQIDSVPLFLSSDTASLHSQVNWWQRHNLILLVGDASHQEHVASNLAWMPVEGIGGTAVIQILPSSGGELLLSQSSSLISQLAESLEIRHHVMTLLGALDNAPEEVASVTDSYSVLDDIVALVQDMIWDIVVQHEKHHYRTHDLDNDLETPADAAVEIEHHQDFSKE